MKSCTVTYALKHLTIRLAWCVTNTSTGNTDMCVHVEPPSHSQASYIRTWLCIDGMHHITAFTKNCQHSFKNQGDLKRHAAEHYRQPHECPDCNYKNSDIRNLESHRLKHTDINKYTCEKCGKDFRYNTQYRRHLKDPSKCTVPKRSKSLEF